MFDLTLEAERIGRLNKLLPLHADSRIVKVVEIGEVDSNRCTVVGSDVFGLMYFETYLLKESDDIDDIDCDHSPVLDSVINGAA